MQKIYVMKYINKIFILDCNVNALWLLLGEIDNSL